MSYHCSRAPTAGNWSTPTMRTAAAFGRLLTEHRTVLRAADGKAVVGERAVGLAVAQDQVALRVGLLDAVEQVAVAGGGQHIGVAAVMGVDGMRPAQAVVEADGEHRQADECGTVGVHLRADQLGLEIRE
jgi:hypothetical protein